jgi:hypothetical protein
MSKNRYFNHTEENNFFILVDEKVIGFFHHPSLDGGHYSTNVFPTHAFSIEDVLKDCVEANVNELNVNHDAMKVSWCESTFNVLLIQGEHNE